MTSRDLRSNARVRRETSWINKNSNQDTQYFKRTKFRNDKQGRCCTKPVIESQHTQQRKQKPKQKKEMRRVKQENKMSPRRFGSLPTTVSMKGIAMAEKRVT